MKVENGTSSNNLKVNCKGDNKMSVKNNTQCKEPENEKIVINKITKLHNQLITAFKMSLSLAIEIGGLLDNMKTQVGHGKWLNWITKNLPFCPRTATNYVKVHRKQDKLKTENISDLQTAYKLLSNPDSFVRHNKRNETDKWRREYADGDSDFKNTQKGNYINTINNGNNLKVMQEMIDNGMEGKVSCILQSPPYNANMYYGKKYDDNKPYSEYLSELLKRYPLYSRLLRPGGRVITIIGGVVKNHSKEKTGEDYYHPIVSDLIKGVRDLNCDLNLFNEIIWDKSAKKHPLNKNYGSAFSPSCPVTRSCTERILIWSKSQFVLPNIEGQETDLTKEEFLDWTWDIWKIAPYVVPGNPSPAAFPPKLVERLIKLYSYPGDIICDPYSSSGVTALAAKKLGRKYIGIELNKNYCKYSTDKLQAA